MAPKRKQPKRTPQQSTRLQGSALGTPKGVVRSRSVVTPTVSQVEAGSSESHSEVQADNPKCENPDCRLDSVPTNNCHCCGKLMHHICCITQRLGLFRVVRGERVPLDLTDVLACSTDCYKILQGCKASTLPPLQETDNRNDDIQKEPEKKKSKVVKNNGVSAAQNKVSDEGIEEKIKVISPSEIEVTTVRRHTTAIKCPCRNNCGKLVNIGTYGAHGGGMNGCPHCATNSGRHWRIPSDFISHVRNTKRCLKKQGIESEGMTPIQTLGPVLTWLANDVQYQSSREEGAKYGASTTVKHFTCPSCHVSMLYAHRHAHLVNKHNLRIGAVDAESVRGKDLSAVLAMVTTSGNESNSNT